MLRDLRRVRVGWLTCARLAVLGIGIPLLIYWASREQALSWQAGWSRFLLCGVLLSQCAIMAYTLRFRGSMRIVGVELGFIEAFRITTLSLFYQFFIPLSVGADVSKFAKLRARNNTSFDSVSGIVLDHFVGLVTICAMSGALFAWRRPLVLDTDITLAVVIGIVAMFVLGGLAVHHFRRRKFDARVLATLAWRRRRPLIATLAVSVVMQLLLAAAVYVATVGWEFEIGYFDVLFVLTTAFIFQGLPINLAGVGVSDVAGAGLYVALGVPVSVAILLVSLLYGYRLITAIIGGIWDLLPGPGNPSKPADRQSELQPGPPD